MTATVRLAGSARTLHGSSADGPTAVRSLDTLELSRTASVTVHVREAPHLETLAVRMARDALTAPRWRTYLSSSALHGEHGPAVDDIGSVLRWASGAGLQIGAVHAATRRVELTAPLGALARAFAVDLELRHTTDWRTGEPVLYRDHRDELRLPARLDGVVTAVLGLSDRPLSRPHLVGLARDTPATVAYTPEMLAGIYNFPILESGGEGRRITVGIAELGGAVDPVDLAEFTARYPRLRVVEEAVDGAVPRSDPMGPDTEVALDWQVIARAINHCAPRADLEIVIRYAPNTDRGFTDVTAAFAADGRDYAAVSTSWGAPEDFWTPSAMNAMDGAYQMCAARGIVHCVAAGDNGSTDGRRDRRQHADHPASAPHAVSCGGTRLLAVAGRRVSETAWNELEVEQGATGGGVSGHFSPPHYQVSAGILPLSANDGRPGRGVPDVSGNADPTTGYIVRRDGADVVVGGTSAVAPLWSALFALAAADLGHRLGFVQPALYRSGAGFHDIVSGDNGAYPAHPGWDATTGLGTPDGRALCAALSSVPPEVRGWRAHRRSLQTARGAGPHHDRVRRTGRAGRVDRLTTPTEGRELD
jgi:kumamolisin